MPRIQSSTPLDSGDRFPSMTLACADGTTIALPRDDGRWTVFLGYRGLW